MHTFVYSFSLCCTEVIAPRTLNRFTLDLMLDAVPYSSASILDTLEIWSPGGMISEIMEVPLPLASWRLLMSFLTFQISTFLSEVVSSPPPAPLMTMVLVGTRAREEGRVTLHNNSAGGAEKKGLAEIEKEMPF